MADRGPVLWPFSAARRPTVRYRQNKARATGFSPTSPTSMETNNAAVAWDDEDEVTMKAPEGAGEMGAKSLRDAQLEEERAKLKARAEKFGVEYKEPSMTKVRWREVSAP